MSRFFTERQPPDDLLERVREATAVREPRATIVARRDERYLRVTAPRGGGGVLEQWPVGVVDGDATQQDLEDFVRRVHTPFTAYDRHVPSELVYGGAPASDMLVAEAGRLGVRLRSFVDYQGLLDLRPLDRWQRDALAADRDYPAELYVPQRFRRIGAGAGPTDAGPTDAGPTDAGPPEAEPERDLLDRVVHWLGADGARLVVVLADFGHGKTFLLRQLARVLPERLPRTSR